MLQGTVVDESERPLTGVTVQVLGRRGAATTNDSGAFLLTVPAGKALGIVFSYTGYRTLQQNFLLATGETERLTVRLLPGNSTQLEEVTVRDMRERNEAGLIRPNPKNIINLPSPVTGVESLIKILVGSNNELSSQYNVRGGSFDENLIYVNDFEIFRPYLVRSGQQEGLSFINPALVRNISFYTGGFGARYGDKLSSVLDIEYTQPKDFGGSAYVSLLEQGVHLEGISRNKRFTYLAGARHRSNTNLLSSQATQGAYIPSSADVQALLTYTLNRKWKLEALGNLSTTRFQFYPRFTQLTSSVFSPFYTQNIGADIFFEGGETDAYDTRMLGLSATHRPRQALRLTWMASSFLNLEAENIDITGAYLFGDRDFDRSSTTFNQIVNPLGAGRFQTFARNRLRVENQSLSHRGAYDRGRQHWQWGLTYDRNGIGDRLQEFELQDSAGYSLPYSSTALTLSKALRSNAYLTIKRISGFVQNNLFLRDTANAFTVQAGVRWNWNDLNGELLLSPRLAASWKPAGRRDVVYRMAVGAYHQPPFYRELRRYDGSLNRELKAQRSIQAVAGLDYNFVGLRRPLRVTVEAYYKRLSRVVPYDIDNVRLRYFGENSARAYAVGLETRLFGEVVQGAESWISFGIMRTRENLEGDTYKNYTVDRTGNPTDSTTVEGGWLRRPTDRLLTLGAFFQDYLATNRNFKFYLSLLYGTNLPYNIPGSVKYRNALEIPAYIRADLGFSALLLDPDRAVRRHRSPFRSLRSVWASVEVFNIIDRPNTVSYQLIKDFANNTFALPNRLTPRLLNAKIVAEW